MHAMDKDDGIPWTQIHFPEFAAVVGIQVDDNAAALHNKHLLEIGNGARERMVVVWSLGETRLMGQQPELKRGLGRRKKSRGVYARSGPDNLGVNCAFENYAFGDHVGVLLLPAQFVEHVLVLCTPPVSLVPNFLA